MTTWQQRMLGEGRCMTCGQKAVWSVRLRRRLVYCARHLEASRVRSAKARER